jgi:hypothetical protein
MRQTKYSVRLSEEERVYLRTLIGQGTAPTRLLTHTRTLLKADQGEGGPGWTDATIAGASDELVIAQWVWQRLLPVLRLGQEIVLDNLSVQKNPAARAAIETAGCALCFLSAYSSGFNPIERLSGQLKTHLRRRRAPCAVVDAIGSTFD